MYLQMNRISIACTLLAFFCSIHQTATANPEAHKALVERRIDLWHTGDLTIADEIFAVDFVSHVPHYSHVTDLESYKAEVLNTRASFPGFRVEVHNMMVEGNKVACRYTNHYTGPMGQPVTAMGITIDYVVDGKIVEEWWSVDVSGVMQQLGMMPPSRQDYTWGTPSTVTGDPGDPDTNRALFQRWIEEVMNQKNLQLIDEFMAADYVMHTNAAPIDVHGPEGVKQVFGMYALAFPDVQITVEDTIAAADQVLFRWSWTGTHTGELMGIPPTGREITVVGISIHRFADGKFVETWASDNVLSIIKQLTTPEWPLAGVWITSLPTPMGNLIVKSIWAVQNTEKTLFTGEFEQINAYPLLIDVYPDADRIKFAGAVAQKTGLNTYEMTAIEYFTKNVALGLEEIVGIGIVSGTFELTGPDQGHGQGMGAYYTADQDLDQDGFPDEGQEPAICAPWEWTAKRLTMMPGCVPMP